MADRLSQYPMLSNFNNNILQQQLQQQQPSQQLQDSHSILPPSTLDQAMIWQQMQMQQQFRPHGTVEMNSHAPAQLADMMKRTPGMNRVHAAAQLQQQLGQQQQQQSFALGVGMPQMSGGSSVLGGASQPQSFHDSSSNHAQTPHMPPGFPNMSGMNNGNTPGSLQQRRQLGLTGMAQNQQPQNGPVFNKFNQQLREQQQHREREQHHHHQQQQQQFQTAAMNHSSPGDIFPSPGMSNEAIRRPSPHPVNIQSTSNMSQGSAPQSGNIITPASNGGRIAMQLQELSNRAMTVRQHIVQIETQMGSISQQLNANRGSPQEAPLVQRLKELDIELGKSRDNLQRLIGMANYSKQHGGALQPGGGSNPGQPSWMSHSGAPQSFEQNVQARNGQVQGQHQQQQQLPSNAVQPSPSLSQSQLGFVPPRSGPTPQQQGQPGPQHPPSSFNISPNAMGTSFSFPANGTPSTGAGPSPLIQPNRPPGGNIVNNFGKGLINPLDKTRFDLTYKNFCQRKGLKLDQRLLTIESQTIDLHALHVQVLQEGGSKNIDDKDMWNIIGARMGFVQFHRTENEPAKSGPGVAQQLAHIYKEYLSQFDGFYVSQQRTKIQQANANFQAQVAAFNCSPQQMQAVIALSHMSVQELHAQNIPEKMIQFVENHRASLQRTHQDQNNFHRTLRGVNPLPPQGGSQISEQGRPSVPGPPGIGPSNSFGGSPVGLTIAARQQFLQQQQQQQRLQNTVMQGRPPPQGGPQLQQSSLPVRSNNPAMAHAESLIAKYKHEYTTSNIPAMPAIDVPVEQRAEYNRILDQLFRQCQDTDSNLGKIYVLLKQDDLLQKLITIICTVQHQRSLLSTTSNPRFIISLDTIRNMASELQRATDMFTSMVQAVMAGHRPFHQTPQQQPQPHQQHIQQPLQQQNTINNNLLTPSNAMNPAPDMLPHSRPPVHQQQISNPLLQQQQQTQNPNSSLRPPVTAPSIKVQRKPQQSSSAASASTPSPAAAATPVASTPTPTAVASSPPAPAMKSPKGKASGKPKATISPTKRRVSKVVPPPVSAEPVQSSPSTSNRNTKRPHDDNASNGAGPASGSNSAVANEPSPPKRIKTEWDSAPSEALRKKNEAIDSIKTEEDASIFLEQMTAELIKMAANGEGQSLSSDISDTLEMILKGYGPIPDISGAMSLGESSSGREPSPPAPPMDSFDEFFDFSFGTDDENNSKAPTPDLVSSSSTNPSPESNHEVDAANHGLSSSSAMEIKTEEQPDHLRLGTWKEIDHGEATYYNPTTEWKWDSPMPSHDQPWAIFNS